MSSNDALFNIMNTVEIRVPEGFSGTLVDYTNLLNHEKINTNITIQDNDISDSYALSESKSEYLFNKALCLDEYKYYPDNMNDIVYILHDAYIGDFNYKRYKYIPVAAYLVLAVYHPEILLDQEPQSEILWDSVIFLTESYNRFYELLISVILAFNPTANILRKLTTRMYTDIYVKPYHILMILESSDVYVEEKNKIAKVLSIDYLKINDILKAIRYNCSIETYVYCNIKLKIISKIYG